MEKWIRLKGLRIGVRIGIHDFERVAPQPYRISISLCLPNDYRVLTESITDALDYDRLYNGVKTYLSSQHFELQETVIEHLVALCFDLDSRVQGVDIEVAKESVYPDCEGVGLHYRMGRQDFLNQRSN